MNPTEQRTDLEERLREQLRQEIDDAVSDETTTVVLNALDAESIARIPATATAAVLAWLRSLPIEERLRVAEVAGVTEQIKVRHALAQKLYKIIREHDCDDCREAASEAWDAAMALWVARSTEEAGR